MSKDIKKEKSTKEKTQSSYQKEKDSVSKDLTENVFRKKKKQAIEKIAYLFALAQRQINLERVQRLDYQTRLLLAFFFNKTEFEYRILYLYDA